MKLIETKGIAKVYADGTSALNGVSLEIDEGEFLAVMGPSGSGKSTLLHILGFLDRPTSGVYKFGGKDMEKYSEKEMASVRNKKMGFVFQAFNLLPRTSVLENVKLPLLYSDKKESSWNKLAEEAIESVGLSHRINHSSSKLSGGEKQRAAIARALINDPQVIFADEPTGNLDSKSGQGIMEILQELNRKDGRTIILVTHETYTAELADRIVKLRDGKIVKDSRTKNHRNAGDNFAK